MGPTRFNAEKVVQVRCPQESQERKMRGQKTLVYTRRQDLARHVGLSPWHDICVIPRLLLLLLLLLLMDPHSFSDCLAPRHQPTKLHKSRLTPPLSKMEGERSKQQVKKKNNNISHLSDNRQSVTMASRRVDDSSPSDVINIKINFLPLLLIWNLSVFPKLFFSSRLPPLSLDRHSGKNANESLPRLRRESQDSFSFLPFTWVRRRRHSVPMIRRRNVEWRRTIEKRWTPERRASLSGWRRSSKSKLCVCTTCTILLVACPQGEPNKRWILSARWFTCWSTA